MNGVEVLNTIPGRGLNVVFAVLAAFFIIFTVILIFNDCELGIITLLLAVACLLLAVPQNTQYKVTISDNVSFKEFNEKYEVISQNGDIFTVEMREKEDD